MEMNLVDFLLNELDIFTIPELSRVINEPATLEWLEILLSKQTLQTTYSLARLTFAGLSSEPCGSPELKVYTKEGRKQLLEYFWRYGIVTALRGLPALAIWGRGCLEYYPLELIDVVQPYNEEEEHDEST